MAGRRYDTTARDTGDSVAALGDLHDDGLRPKVGLIRVVIDKQRTRQPDNRQGKQRGRLNKVITTYCRVAVQDDRYRTGKSILLTGTGTPGR